MKQESRTLAILAHVLGLIAYFIGPLIILLVTKDKDVKKHARNALNWQISLIIYFIVAGILVFLLIGFLLLPALAIVNIVFSIMAAVKASNDELWKYPLSIQFLK